MINYNNTACVSYNEIVPELIYDEYLKRLIKRGAVSMVRRGSNGTAALIEFNTLPSHIKERYIKKIGA